MNWYIDIEKNYNNIQYKNKINLITKYGCSRENSIQDFICKVNINRVI